MPPENLKEILDLHAKWLRCAPAGKRADLEGANLFGANLFGANLEGATGIIPLGHPDHWMAYAWLREGRLSIRVGCREMRLEEARPYWAGKKHRQEVLAAVNYAATIAQLRGWKL